MTISWSKSVLLLAAAWVAVMFPLNVLAQSPSVPSAVDKPLVGTDGKPLAFAVSSVRRDLSGTGSCGEQDLHVTPTGFHMGNCALIVALFMAYVPSDGAFMGFSTNGRTVGAPDWMKSELYTIDARVDEADRAAWQEPTKQKEMMHAMLQSLLQERCKLATHREMTEKPVYALVLGKGGPKFQEAKSLEPAAIRAQHPEATAVPGGGGMFSFGANGSIDFYAVPLNTLAVVLSNKTGRAVLDKTGLTGRYDVKLEMPQPEPSADGAPDPQPSIFTLVQEQLGLKLESAKDTVETLVIDHVERPSEN